MLTQLTQADFVEALVSVVWHLQVIKLGLSTCMTEPDERVGSGNSSAMIGESVGKAAPGGPSPSSSSSSSSSTNAGGALLLPSSSSSGSLPSSSTLAAGAPSSISSLVGVMVSGSASSGSRSGAVSGGSTGTGGGGGPEESLPLGTAAVLWELECCVAYARLTLMNLNEGRANHFGVFRAGVYVKEMCMLEEKVRTGGHGGGRG